MVWHAFEIITGSMALSWFIDFITQVVAGKDVWLQYIIDLQDFFISLVIYFDSSCLVKTNNNVDVTHHQTRCTEYKNFISLTATK
jgi:hypothetical protein